LIQQIDLIFFCPNKQIEFEPYFHLPQDGNNLKNG